MSITIDGWLNNSKPADLKQKPQIKINVMINNFNFNVSAQQLSIVLKSVQRITTYGSHTKRYEVRPTNTCREYS